jgi:hypothetical protein
MSDPDRPDRRSDTDATAAPSRRKRMHEDVPTWCDCCSCEPEPRWAALEDARQHPREPDADARTDQHTA